MSLRFALVTIAVACALAGCKREAAPPPAAPAAPTPAAVPSSPPSAPAPTAPAPAPSASSRAGTPIESVAVTSATLGNAVNADKRVTAATDTFHPQDTIFITVETSGAAGATLTARWTYQTTGTPTRVNEDTQRVPPGGPSVTEFHVSKPDGWPRGEYQVVVLVNDEPAVTKKFTVR